MMQAVRGTIEALHSDAASILRNEKKTRVEGRDGVLPAVPDEAGSLAGIA